MVVLRILSRQVEIMAFEVRDLGAVFALARILCAGTHWRYELQQAIPGVDSALGYVDWYE